MAVYFIDSSALVKRYVNEVGTTFVTSITDPAAGHHTYVARITGAEVIAALARRGRAGDVSAAALAAALGQFRQEFETVYRVGLRPQPPASLCDPFGMKSTIE